MLYGYLKFQRIISFDFLKVFQNQRIVESGSLKQIKTKELSISSFSKILKELAIFMKELKKLTIYAQLFKSWGRR
jgi:hypothetical protein